MSDELAGVRRLVAEGEPKKAFTTLVGFRQASDAFAIGLSTFPSLTAVGASWANDDERLQRLDGVDYGK